MLMRFLPLLLVAGIGCAALPAQQATPAQPNILLILSDDAGWADFGFHGDESGLTPRLDQLAAQGVVCEQAYVSASVCCPSRAGLMTGRYQQRFGHEFNGPGKPEPGFTQADMGLAREERTLASLLRARGYTTAAMGKWHLGSEAGLRPRERGFDHWFGFLGGSRSYFSSDAPGLARQLQNDDQIVPETQIGYLTDTLAEHAAEYVRLQADDPRPFFLYLAFNAPHTPMHALEADLARFEHIENKRRRQYAAMLYAMDRGIGRVLDALASSGQAEHSLVIFLNDNGGATNNGSSSGAWRGRKGSKWEGGSRVPLLLRWPGQLPDGLRYPSMVSSLDLAPTLLAAAGAPQKASQERSAPIGAFDGVNLLPSLRASEASTPHSSLYWRRGVAAALREGPWKLVRVDTLPPQLMHLERDASELTDFASKEPERVRRMLLALVRWESELAAPRWTEGPTWAKNQLRKHSPEVDTRAEEEQFPD
jgi:arylsulfatase A-like enzyme